MCATFDKLIRGNTETANPHYSKGILKLHGDGQFSKYVLSRIIKIIKANIQFNQERQTICFGKRTTGFL